MRQLPMYASGTAGLEAGGRSDAMLAIYPGVGRGLWGTACAGVSSGVWKAVWGACMAPVEMAGAHTPMKFGGFCTWTLKTSADLSSVGCLMTAHVHLVEQCAPPLSDI
eukprot:364328-Chlamydomonas_euryale.AAC.9